MTQAVVVFTGITQSGDEYVIRYPQLSDAQAMLSYVNSLSEEQTFVNMQGEQKTLEEEQHFLEEELVRITEHQSVLLLVTLKNAVIGIATITLGKGASSHVGSLGISLSSTFRGEGIGSNLLKYLLEEVEKNLTKIRIVSLSSFADNIRAKKLYQKFGFKETGKLPEGLFRQGKYSDLVSMYKKLK